MRTHRCRLITRVLYEGKQTHSREANISTPTPSPDNKTPLRCEASGQSAILLYRYPYRLSCRGPAIRKLIASMVVTGACALLQGCSTQSLDELGYQPRTQIPASSWTASTTEESSAQPIKWKVRDRFRLFGAVADSEARARIEKLMDRLASSSDIRGEYDEILRVLSGPGAASLRASNFDQQTGQYQTGYLKPDHYEIDVSLREPAPNELCSWSVKEDAGLNPPLDAAPCGETVRLKVRAPDPGNWWKIEAVVQAEITGGPVSRTITQDIRLHDVLVVALGDSFISGEGNPDVPARFGALSDENVLRTHPELKPILKHPSWPADKRLADVAIKGGEALIRKAEWWYAPCHRSLLSWPVVSSLHASARREHEAITLVHLGCSGAEVMDGLLVAQGKVPGRGKTEDISQFEQLDNLLAQTPRPIDRVFLSIGGNDVGFAGVVAYAALPPNGYWVGDTIGGAIVGKVAGVVGPEREDTRPLSNLTRLTGASAEERLQELPQKYAILTSRLTSMNLGREQVFQIRYPSPLKVKLTDPATGETKLLYCRSLRSVKDVKEQPLNGDEAQFNEWAYGERNGGASRDSGFEALSGQVPFLLRWRADWLFQFSHALPARRPPPEGKVHDCPKGADRLDPETCKVQRMMDRLNERVRANDEHWMIVDKHNAKIDGHGWCAKSGLGYRLSLPQVKQSGLEPRDMLSFEPYDLDLQRWFRTANDSVFTQYRGPELYMQGTAHPTFRAHVEIAQSVFDAAFSDPD